MKKTRLGMNLQFFAEDTGSNGGGDNPDNTTTEETVELNVDELSEDQLTAIKEKFGFKDDDDIDTIIKGRKAKWQKEQDAKQKEADRLASMNEDEKAEHEKQKLLDRIAELEKKDNFTAMSKEASKMLSEASITADDEILNFVVKDTAEDTQQAVNSFISLIDRKAEEKTKAALSGKPPVVNLTPGKQMTKDEIMKIADPTKRQQAIKENIHLFRK
ncbi:DUF4355 domain-containing protein [Enterococcus wangshanyuanii]|uniref:Phage capsid protein n=1 Tax=Enterococcus wangshanyuanii TaxID=2005703 RepID=A0ABQ1PU33_9ENTE|nr:DUF4355 domain-containing protein [Enterococcus wangshanyuanii]GGD03662.1 phage capsid protein [Enterococcus wangshanyuanii]